MQPILTEKVGKKTVYRYNNLTFDSKEEVYFYWYAKDLMNAGLVDKITYSPEPYQLFHDIQIPINNIDKKGRHTVKNKTILDGMIYTPDFELSFKFEALERLIFDIGGLCYGKLPPFFSHFTGSHKAMFEVKPSFDQNNMSREFKIKQKIVYNKYNIYVNLVKVPDIFEKTFVPERYFYTDKDCSERKLSAIKHVRTLAEYLETI